MKSFKLAALMFMMAAVISSYESRAASNTENGGDVKRSFKVNKGGLLKISINTGDINVETWNRNEVSVSVGDVEENKNDLSIYQSGNNVTVQCKGSGYYSNSDIKIFAPVEFNVEIKTNQGDVTLRNELKGSFQATTGGGDVTFGNISGQVNIKTYGGEITAGNIYNDLVLASNGGDITVGNVYGKGDVQTMGGSIRAGNVGKYLYVKTMGGDITTGDIGGDAEVNTMGGSIFVKKVSGNARLSTNGGDVKILGSTGPVSARTYGGSLYLYNINGSINASTASGDIYAELRSVKGSSKLESMNGMVKLSIDPNVKATIYANVNLGGWGETDEKPIVSEFPAKSYESGKYSGSVSATYKINGGGDSITIKSINNNIEIHKLRK